MADNSLNAVIEGSKPDDLLVSHSTLNKNSHEFKPKLLHSESSGVILGGGEEEYMSTVGTALDGMLSGRQGNSAELEASVSMLRSKYQQTPTGSVSPSPMPSTAHATPQMSAVVLPPPPGYDPIVDGSDAASAYSFDNMYYDPSMYSSPTCSWRSYPPPFHLGHKLFVGALPYSVSEADLFPLFGQFGEILELHVQRDWLGRSKGCAWLRYSTVEECDAAIEALHNNYFLGSMNRPMQLTYASDSTEKKTRLRTASYSTNSVVGDDAPPAPPAEAPADASAASLPPSTSVLSKLRLMMSQSSSASVEVTPDHQPAAAAVTPLREIRPASLTRLEVSGFPATYSNGQVEELLSQFGPVCKMDRVSAVAAVVNFQFPRDADRARSVMDGVTLPGCDHPITVLSV